MHSQKKTPPASVRYFKARLQPLRRPLFWSSLAVLSLLSLSVWQYWKHPEWLETTSGTTADDSATADNPNNRVNKSNLSPEELAAGADIDNLQLLLEDLEKNQNSLPVLPAETKKSKDSSKPENLYTQFSQKSKEKQSEISEQNPLKTELFSNSTQELLDRASLKNNNTPLNVNQDSNSNTESNTSPIGSLPAPSINQTSLPESPLQQAIDDLPPLYSNTTPNVTYSQGTTGINTTAPTLSNPTIPNQSNNYPQSSGVTTGTQTPNTPGVNTPVAPNNTGSVNPYSYNQSNPSAVTPTNSGANTGYNDIRRFQANQVPSTGVQPLQLQPNGYNQLPTGYNQFNPYGSPSTSTPVTQPSVAQPNVNNSGVQQVPVQPTGVNQPNLNNYQSQVNPQVNLQQQQVNNQTGYYDSGLQPSATLNQPDFQGSPLLDQP